MLATKPTAPLAAGSALPVSMNRFADPSDLLRTVGGASPPSGSPVAHGAHLTIVRRIGDSNQRGIDRSERRQRLRRDASAAIPIPELTARAAQGGEGSAAVFRVLDRFIRHCRGHRHASTVFLLALMVMLVEERRETVGILRLIGLRKGRILLQVFAEGLLIAAAGAVFGILFAAALQGAVNASSSGATTRR